MPRKGILTQEEIDALLRISTIDNFASLENKAPTIPEKSNISREHLAITTLMIRSLSATKITTLEEFLNWQVGHFLPLSLSTVTVDIAKTPIFTATIDRHIDKRSLKLIDKIDYAQKQKKEEI